VRKELALVAFVSAAALAHPARAADSPKTEEQAPVKSVSQPDDSYTYAEPQYYPSFVWIVTQLVPSPELAVGKVTHIEGTGESHDVTTTAFGLRWQLTPLVWSWGVNRHLSRWRWFVIDPLARNAGSVELNTCFEYLWGDVNRFLARPGVRATFPIIERGEYLSASIGTSIYRYDDTMRVAYDFGVHFLYGILGVQATVAPAHAPLRTIATLTVRYF
jgi:hypothetical protein